MNVIDHEPQLWFLLQEADALFVDGNYNHSFLGYDWMIELSPEEREQYRQRGHEFINWLVQDIQNSAPVLQISHSPYKSRRVPASLYERASKAIEAWKQGRESPASGL